MFFRKLTLIEKKRRSYRDAPENRKVACSLTFYQMDMKGNVVLVRVDYQGNRICKKHVLNHVLNLQRVKFH